MSVMRSLDVLLTVFEMYFETTALQETQDSLVDGFLETGLNRH